MAILDITGIAGLSGTSWELDELVVSGESLGIPQDETFAFGAATLNPSDVSVDLDRSTDSGEFNGCTLEADDNGGVAENIRINWQGTQQTFDSIDLTGTVLTMFYSAKYYEKYNKIP